MTIWIESTPGFLTGRDAYGRAIVGSFDSSEIAKACADFLQKQAPVAERKIQVKTIPNAMSVLDALDEEDLLFSIFINFYNEVGGKGLRGFYRSTKRHNSEKCKALSITVTKAVKDHTDLYYHGVYNEVQVRAPQLEALTKSRSLASGVEIGLDAEDKIQCSHPMFHKNLGDGIGTGILRHLGGKH